MYWSDTPPADCPAPRSDLATGIEFTGRQVNYTSADTWYPAWGDDDVLYSPWTDGSFGPELTFPHDCSSQTGNDANRDHPGLAGTGHARITGNDPMNLTVENLGIDYQSSLPYGGRYPSASLVHGGVWYYGTYCVDETGRTDAEGQPLNWDVLGPFVGFRTSTDGGRTWAPCPHTPEAPLFGESGKNGAKVRLGVPHMVDFGRGMAGSPDGHAYLVGHGTDDPGAEAAWIRGDGAWMARARPDPQNPAHLNDPAAWSFFAGHDGDGAPLWADTVAEAQPILRWRGRIGHVTMTHVPALGRYLMWTTDGGDTISAFNSALWEGPGPTGPWKLVTWMERFGEQAYFLNTPSRFLHEDGRGGWLALSANFTAHHLGRKLERRPAGAAYALSLHEYRLKDTAPA